MAAIAASMAASSLGGFGNFAARPTRAGLGRHGRAWQGLMKMTGTHPNYLGKHKAK